MSRFVRYHEGWAYLRQVTVVGGQEISPNDKVGPLLPGNDHHWGLVYMPTAITTYTSAQPKVGTGLPPTPPSCGISHVCNFKVPDQCIFWYNGHPTMVTDSPVSISTNLLMPSTVIGINQHPGWLVDSMLSSLATSESDDSVRDRRLDWSERLLVCEWEQTLCVAGIGVEAWDLLWASTTAR